jgi:hypothetical protein
LGAERLLSRGTPVIRVRQVPDRGERPPQLHWHRIRPGHVALKARQDVTTLVR